MHKSTAMMFTLVLLFGTAGCTLFKISVGEEVQPFTEKVIAGEGRDKILLLDISGFISSASEGSSLLGTRNKPGLLSQVREQLDRARSDRAVKGLLLRINSPGGGVTASDMLYHELVKFKNDTGVKVLAHIMDIGTSGAYYAALSADLITAQPTGVTGSIGVIMYSFDGTSLMQKIGLQAVEISSGTRKGMGSPFRPLVPEERAIFQNVIDSLQGRFVNTVTESRKLPLETVKSLSDGRIFTSQEAQAAGLIDSIGYLDDAIDQVKNLAHLKKASVVTYIRPGEYRSNLYSLNLINIDMGDVMGPGANFLYVWWP
ncbi:MAG TPA: signal peptide peptidase SppA [Nitrospirota bacterium]|nr:signal peptide peptidase SppA [Nitrospirota bacterium]